MNCAIIKFKDGSCWRVRRVEEYREFAGVGNSSFIELKFENEKVIHVLTDEIRAIGFEEEFENVEEYEYM